MYIYMQYNNVYEQLYFEIMLIIINSALHNNTTPPHLNKHLTNTYYTPSCCRTT